MFVVTIMAGYSWRVRVEDQKTGRKYEVDIMKNGDLYEKKGVFETK